MKGIALFLVLTFMIGSITTESILDLLQDTIAKAALQKAIDEKNKELEEKLSEREIAKDMFNIVKEAHRQSYNSKKKKRLLKRQVANQNNFDNQQNLENFLSEQSDNVSPLDFLLNGMNADNNEDVKDSDSFMPYRQTMIIRGPIGLGDSSPFNNQFDNVNDIDEENPVLVIREKQEPEINPLAELLAGYSDDQPSDDLDNVLPTIKIRKRGIRRRRIQRRYKRTTIRKRKVTSKINNEPISTPEEDQNFETALANLIKNQLSETAKVQNNDQNSDEDNDDIDDNGSPTVIILKTGDEPNDDIPKKKLNTNYNVENLKNNDNEDSSSPLDFLGNLLTGVTADTASNKNSSNLDNNNENDDSTLKSEPLNGISIPMQIIGGLLSNLFQGLGGKDIDEESRPSSLLNLQKDNSVQRIRRVHRIHRKKKVTIKHSKRIVKPLNSIINNNPLSSLRRNKPNVNNLPKIDTQNVRYPLLGGMYNKDRYPSSTLYPSIGHGVYKKTFKPLSISDYINSPSSTLRPVIRKRRVHRRQVRRRVVHRKRVIKRPVEEDNSVRDIVNSLMGVLPQLKNIIRV